MLASANARNYGACARTRAAVLCFGGWGLQAMLHLWPRLRLIQEEREVLGRARELPNLDRLTAFAAILPATTPAADSPPFHVFRPNPDRYPPPAYLASRLTAIRAEAARTTASGLTQSEWIGARLLQRAREDGYIRPLAVSGPPKPAWPEAGQSRTDDGACAWPATRNAAFRAGMAAAGPIVRTLLHQVVDSTRLDSMQIRDPFVQTTIYVIAALGEPRTSALVWPVVSELAATFSQRHVSRVVAFFSTASFASDESRIVEEATTHMALRELEALTGAAGPDDRPDFLARWLAEDGGSVWSERVGHRLFDAIYLVDREKSNQALAESALDLAVLVGNAIEAFLTADGLAHIERALGPELQTGRPLYNVVGAASDYVPLAEYVAAAIEEEQKEVIRTAVLAGDSQPVAVQADLRALGATPDVLARRFLEAGATSLYGPASDRPTSTWPPAVQIAEDRFLTLMDPGEPDAARAPQRWLERLQSCTAAIAAEIEEACAAAQAAWGLTTAGRPAEASNLLATGGEERLAPNDAISPAHPGVIPQAAALAARQIVADMRSAPDGILRARARLAGWLDAVTALLRDLQPAIATADEEDEDYRARLYAWRSAFASAVAQRPQMVIRWARILAAAWLIAFGLAGVLLLQRGLDLGREGRIALVAGLVAVLAGLGVAAWQALVERFRQLERQRIALAREALSRLATRLFRRGLWRTCSELAGELAGLQTAVEEALAELRRWAHAGPEPESAAAYPDDAPTRAAISHGALWSSVQGHIRRESGDGAHALARFRALWRAEGDDAPPWAAEDNRLARRLAAALAAHRQTPGNGAALADVFKEYAARATEDLYPTHRLLADHPDLAREMIEQFSAEQMLASTHGQEGPGAGDHHSADAVERLYVRARPAASFEVTYLLSSDVLEVEFGVCADAPTSSLRRVFEQRGLPLFSSYDPLALTLIRTVNRLSPAELILTERCRDAYLSLSSGERVRLSLLPTTEAHAAAILYGEDLLTRARDTHAPTRTPA